MSNSVLKEVMKYYKETNVGILVMCKIQDKIENDGIQERQIESNINAIKNIMNKLNKLDNEYEKYKEIILK